MSTARPASHSRHVVFRAATLLAIGTAAATVASLSCAARADPPNVLLIVLDTTRRDHLSLYGYARNTTPAIDAFAETATVFTNAHSTSGWTSSSHASLFTGLFPAAHHVTQEAWHMPEHLRTLAEVLQENGYRTEAMVGNPMVREALGFAQGFDAFHELWREAGDADATAHPAVLHLARLLDAPRPFFAFVNLIEPHSPYTSGPHLGAFRSHPDNVLKSNHWRAVFAGGGELSTDDLEHLSELYDGELRHTDDIVASLISAVEAKGALDDTVVIIASDHGENFGEHDLVDHVFNLYDTTTRIPLVIRFPTVFPAGPNDKPVQLHDLFPTVLGLAGVKAPASQGVDLATEAIDEERPLLLSYGYPNQALHAMGEESAASERLLPYKRRLWAVRVGDMKLIVGDDDSVELYRVSSDPGELDDLARDDAHAATVAELRGVLAGLLEQYSRDPVDARTTGDPTRDDETIEELRALGYAE